MENRSTVCVEDGDVGVERQQHLDNSIVPSAAHTRISPIKPSVEC
jgi:hypothetical protein